MNLIPQPCQLKKKAGSFSLKNNTVRISADAKAEVCIKHKLKTLGLKLTDCSCPGFSAVIGKPGIVKLSVPRKAEGYALYCDKNGVRIQGVDKDGLFWGVTTLEQLLAGGKSGIFYNDPAAAYISLLAKTMLEQENLKTLEEAVSSYPQILKGLGYWVLAEKVPGKNRLQEFAKLANEHQGIFIWIKEREP